MAEDLKEKDEGGGVDEFVKTTILFETHETYEDDGGVGDETVRVITQEPGYEHTTLTYRIRREMLKYQKTQGLPLCEFLTNDLLSSFIQWTVENLENV